MEVCEDLDERVGLKSLLDIISQVGVFFICGVIMQCFYTSFLAKQ